jgi:hypothetical protein
VPTLRDLLEPVEKRPKVFFRGYTVYNPVKVGFVSLKEEAGTIGLMDERERRHCVRTLNGSEPGSMSVNVPAVMKAIYLEPNCRIKIRMR